MSKINWNSIPTLETILAAIIPGATVDKWPDDKWYVLPFVDAYRHEALGSGETRFEACLDVLQQDNIRKLIADDWSKFVVENGNVSEDPMVSNQKYVDQAESFMVSAEKLGNAPIPWMIAAAFKLQDEVRQLRVDKILLDSRLREVHEACEEWADQASNFGVIEAQLNIAKGLLRDEVGDKYDHIWLTT